MGYSNRKRVGETEGLFDDRQIGYEPVELTSRVSTADAADAKRRLELLFSDKNRVSTSNETAMRVFCYAVSSIDDKDGLA